MKLQIYAIFDTCSGLYGSPHFATNDDIVKRDFQDIATGTDNAIAKHPEHYSLWRLANWDNTTGKTNDEKNECLWQAIEAISQAQTVQRPDNLQLFDNGLVHQNKENGNAKPA